MLKDVYITGAWFNCVKALSLREKEEEGKERKKIKETIGRRRRTDSPVLVVESSESGRALGVRV